MWSLCGQGQGYSIELQGGATQVVDAIEEVFGLFPLMVGITTAVVFIFIAVPPLLSVCNTSA